MDGAKRVGGIERPPADLDSIMAAPTVGRGSEPHFFSRRAPAQAQTLSKPERVKLRDGGSATVTHRCLWYLGEVHGMSRRDAFRRINDVLLDPNGWVRTGVHFRRVNDETQAHAVVSVVAPGTTVCGRGAAGCASWGGDGAPLAEVASDLAGNAGAWRMVVAMELPGHLVFALDDMYLPQHQPYDGSMGTWAAAKARGYYPSDAEIEAAKAWLAGATDPRYVHGH